MDKPLANSSTKNILGREKDSLLRQRKTFFELLAKNSGKRSGEAGRKRERERESGRPKGISQKRRWAALPFSVRNRPLPPI
jgi:hypothetical protein